MSSTPATLEVLAEQPIPTWFGIGGKARRLAKPATIEELRECLRLDPALRVLGDGANLLVADEGVSELVVSLAQGDFARFSVEDEGAHAIVRAGAGVNLPKLIHEGVRLGLGGLEGLGGIPASIGGAVMMNAGGAFAEIGSVVHAVHGLERTRDSGGTLRTFTRKQIHFAYRHTLLGIDTAQGPAGAVREFIITSVDLKLRRADPDALRARLLEVMEYKKKSQPLKDNSAGCVFKNPTLATDLQGLAVAGQKVSAGMLIDKAGCKGMKVGGAEVSTTHGNFFVAKPWAKAADVIELIRQVRARVEATFGVRLQTEVVVWGADV